MDKIIYHLGKYSAKIRKIYYNRTGKYKWGLINFAKEDWVEPSEYIGWVSYRELEKDLIKIYEKDKIKEKEPSVS